MQLLLDLRHAYFFFFRFELMTNMKIVMMSRPVEPYMR